MYKNIQKIINYILEPTNQELAEQFINLHNQAKAVGFLDEKVNEQLEKLKKKLERRQFRLRQALGLSRKEQQEELDIDSLREEYGSNPFFEQYALIENALSGNYQG